MAHRKIEEEIERLAQICRPGSSPGSGSGSGSGSGPSPAATAALRKALGDRVNLMVAKAAKLAGELRIEELLPDLLSAFDRLMEKPVERDPQCWGKNAIATALVALDYRESARFLRGARHIQMEPVWGGEADTAATLRGICLLALPSCTDLRREEILRCLVDALTERAHTVRLEAVRAIAQMEGDEAPLLLRFKARVGDEESEVIGQVFDSLLRLEGADALPFLGGFLQSKKEELREEAALALGASRQPAAVDLLREALAAARDPQFRDVLMRALSASRQPAAIELLLDLFRNGRPADSAAALAALELHRASPAIWQMVEAAVDSKASGGWRGESAERKL
ncbi:MAG: HEAT repeat domain-containing protein [Bryobacteraceae bacterium]